MGAQEFQGSRSPTVQPRRMLLELARTEQECAANGAPARPYWTPCPPSVGGHRAAAALRDQADRLLTSLARPALPFGGQIA